MGLLVTMTAWSTREGLDSRCIRPIKVNCVLQLVLNFHTTHMPLTDVQAPKGCGMVSAMSWTDGAASRISVAQCPSL